MKKDKNGLLHDKSGRFAAKVRKERYVKLSPIETLNLMAIVLLWSFFGAFLWQVMGDRIISSIRVLIH